MLKALCAAVGVVLFAGEVARAGQQTGRAPSFSRDVAPIVFARCVTCHRRGGDARFSLTSYDEVRRRAAQIVAVTSSRYMPPWKPEPGYGEFLDARRLTDDQIAVIASWVAAGMPPGDTGDLPPLPEWKPGWHRGDPDLVLQLPRFTLPAAGRDLFRNFVVPVSLSEPRFVRGFQFRPGNSAVHHANIRIDRTSASRQLDEADSNPGYEGVILHSADYPDGHFLGWTPGQVPPLGSDDLSWRLDPGADLVIQLHMQPTGKIEEIAPVIGLYFADGPPARTPAIIRLGRQNLEIPAGESRYRVADSFVLPVDVQVHAIQPHAHYRARVVESWATLPNGSRRPLLRISNWDFNWQDQYRYAAPFWLPAGTNVSIEYQFDNSAENPRNPDRPPQPVQWGWRSGDEMADVWLQVMTRSDADRIELARQARLKMLTEDAIGGETLLRREPKHINLLNDTALIYMELGMPAKALQHFQTVTAVDPHSAAAWYNEGVALEALGARDEAVKKYEEAVRLKPDYSAARNNLGTALVAQGRVDAARREFASAIHADPANAEAHANLGIVLLAAGHPDEALVEVRSALRLQPERVTLLTPFVWLLATHPESSIRRPEEARQLAEQIVAATDRHDPSALDALAASYAALGRFDEAAKTATAAIEAAVGDREEAFRNSIRGRLRLYQRGQAFTVPR